MHVSGWLFLFTAAGFVAQCALLVTVIRYGKGQWPSLLCSVALDVLSTPILATLIHGHYHAYYYGYWFVDGMQQLFRLWIMVDIARSFRGLDFLPLRFHGIVYTIAAVSGVGAFLYAMHEMGPVSGITVLPLVRAFAAGWCGFTIVILGTTKLFAFQWEDLGATVAAGLVLILCADALAADHYLHHYKLSFALDCLANITAYCVWIWALRRPARPDDSNLHLIPVVQDFIRAANRLER